MPDAIRVALCDDHAVVRSGLRRILDDEPDITVVGEAGNAEDAVALATAEHPDVFVMDLGLRGTSGIDATRQVRAASAETAVLVLTVHDDVGYLRRAFNAGATGYLVKSASRAELIGAVRSVARGVLGTAMIQALLAGVGLVVAGVPAAGLLAFVCLILCTVQVGPGLVLVPAMIYLFWNAETTTSMTEMREVTPARTRLAKNRTPIRAPAGASLMIVGKAMNASPSPSVATSLTATPLACAMKPRAAKTPMPASTSKLELAKPTTRPDPVMSVSRPT